MIHFETVFHRKFDQTFEGNYWRFENGLRLEVQLRNVTSNFLFSNSLIEAKTFKCDLGSILKYLGPPLPHRNPKSRQEILGYRALGTRMAPDDSDYRIPVERAIDDFFFNPDYSYLIGTSRDGGKAQILNLIVGRTVKSIDIEGCPTSDLA
ncbi:MAG: hypothetical protein IPK68_20255 [Bdellovibrionales bacterium]|nr:hypothetical protein [Bdellovibrionales bacterium]